MSMTRPERMQVPAAERHAPIDMDAETFRTIGYELVDQVSELFAGIAERPVAPNTSPAAIRKMLGQRELPEDGTDPAELMRGVSRLLMDHSTFNGHPRFWGYITSSAAPIGVLGELLASAINANVGGWQVSPVASEIEAQTVAWIADLLGYPVGGDGLLVSGGNMANLVGLTAARAAVTQGDVRSKGLDQQHHPMCVYVSAETHTWIQTAADMLGLGTDSIRWIPTDGQHRMRIDHLRHAVEADRAAELTPFAVVGTAGSVGTGAVDPLVDLATFCREQHLWFHVDGAYGGLAVAADNAPTDLVGLRDADSVAVDPHKWLYAPLEAGCVLVRDPLALLNAFSYHPTYYHFRQHQGIPETNYYEHGPQNSRGFRALKVWLALQQVGRSGYAEMIGEDIALAQALYKRVSEHPALEPVTQALSITTFRYVPEDLEPGSEAAEAYLNQLNEKLLTRLQRGGEAFLSNAFVDERLVLRACIVNFRTSLEDIEALPEIVARHGADLDRSMRPSISN